MNRAPRCRDLGCQVRLQASQLGVQQRRIPIDQLRRDRAAGLDTAAFLAGYPGSPLGGFDQEMTRARALVPKLAIVHEPAVNEELGATAVMGSQLVTSRPDATRDGVVGGVRVFEYQVTLVEDREGVVQPIVFSYFDPYLGDFGVVTGTRGPRAYGRAGSEGPRC